MASALSALNFAECDFLPFQFYWDVSKQCFDEARHASFYLNMVFPVYNHLRGSIPSSSAVHGQVSEFKTKGRGLIIPTGDAFYPTMWNAELDERLILMNIMTESKSIRPIRRSAQLSVFEKLPDLRNGLMIDACDETFHAKIGKNWLNYLLPSKTAYRKRFDDVNLLRGFLLATTLVTDSSKDLADLLVELSQQR